MSRKEEIAEQIGAIALEVRNLYEKRKVGENEYKFEGDEFEKTIKPAEPKMTELRKELNGIVEQERIKEQADREHAAVTSPDFKGVRFPGASDGHNQDVPGKRKTVGQMFVESRAFKEWNRELHAGPEVEMEAKTLFDEANEFAPQAIRTGYISQFPTRPISVANLIPRGATTQIAVVYMEETTYTNNAVETAEGVAYGEAAFAFTERTATVRKIPVSLPITDEIMEDAPFAESYVTERLGFMVNQRLDSQLVVGNGSAPNLMGLTNVSGSQTQALATDSNADACFKAIVKVQSVGFAAVTDFVLHPLNWQNIRLTKTTQGEYVYGAPWEQGPGTLWGVPVTATTAITQGTGLVGAMRPHCQLAYKREMTMKVGYVNDDLVKGKQTVTASLRVAFPIYRPSAFCKITSML